ncbi:MAG TPA: fatty acid desaturase [Kofleriaceae bacterium]|nr:fatty acid desaturase [Kofleriaceae bacterium]
MATLRIDDHELAAAPRETILQTALRAGVALPNSCRVGGCGTCKCRLVTGAVDERTETSYLLTADELARGYILACQSVPRGDVAIALDAPVAHRVAGRITARARLTADIARITITLAAPLAYRAGQFARLAIAGLDGVSRPYSFATAPGGRDVALIVRRVDGGRMSSVLVDDPDLVGRAVTLDGPHGGFGLRPGDAPLLFVAGGSGLAPILAMLHAALAAGETRPATVMLGARSEADLYALTELAAIADAWRGGLTIVPVVEHGATWPGARGRVTDHLATYAAPGCHAYVCGPPAMIDAAVDRLAALGVARDRLHVDRFTPEAPSEADAQADAQITDAPVAGWRDYAKFLAFHAVGLVALAALLVGGAAIPWTLLAVITLYVVGDAVAGDDTTTPRFTRPGVLTAQLWLALPLLAAIVAVSVWTASPGAPALGFGARVAAWLLTGLMIGMIGTITAHELTHRTWDRRSLVIGRWLLAFSFDTAFAIEHVYGHHRYVATAHDPATAPRGRTVYAHIARSTVAGNVSAWRIERDRLAKRGRGVWSWHNAVLRGYAMSLALVAAAYVAGGARAAAYFVACGLAGKALLEIVNYMEHYGLVRDPDTAVAPRHSWNSNRRISSWTMFRLTRHSHHHAQGEVPYHALRPYPDAPMMIGGYLTTILLTLVPPVWRALMAPRLAAWDAQYATPGERAILDRGRDGQSAGMTAHPAARERTPGVRAHRTHA